MPNSGEIGEAGEPVEAAGIVVAHVGRLLEQRHGAEREHQQREAGGAQQHQARRRSRRSPPPPRPRSGR